MARRHRNGYRFTEKTHSKRGVAALFLSIISIGILVAAVVSSFDSRGNGSSLGEENSFKLFPYLSTLCSLLITGIWVALYVIGFLA